MTTAEIEHWPGIALARELVRHSASVNRDAFPIIVNRPTQKQFFDKLYLPTAPWQLPSECDEWPAVPDCLGELVIVKCRIGSYNGRGQRRLCADETGQLPAKCYGEYTVEQGINSSDKVSLIDARGFDGNTVFYPLTHNLYQGGILHTSVALPQINAQLQTQAEGILSAIVQELNYIGATAMKCLITPQGSLVNELAPRVHNSGHWTQNGTSISQSELHLRATTDLPLPQPVADNPSVIINLIGSDLNHD